MPQMCFPSNRTGRVLSWRIVGPTERRLHAREQRSSLESPATDGFASDPRLQASEVASFRGAQGSWRTSSVEAFTTGEGDVGDFDE